MNQWNRGVLRMWTIAAVAAVALAASACGDAPGGARSTGVVKAVDGSARRVTLDHEDVPGLMKAMTMDFEVAPEVSLEGLAPGARVEFWVEEEAGRYTVTRMRLDGS